MTHPTSGKATPMSANLSSYMARPVPRYTSYPTVPHFAPAVDGDTYRGWLGALDPATPVSLYLHVPFCRQLCWYCGCNMKLATRYEPVADYVEVLLEEIDLVARAAPGRLTLSHLHWGGGTPTALEPADLERCMAAVAARFDFADDAEIAIESDPRTLTHAMTRTIGALGFNRASFGVQEFDPKVQATINRVQPPDMVEASVESLRDAGVSAINFDLIYGLPYQTRETLDDTVDRCAAMRPDRIALFGYAHVPWMAKKQRMIPEEALPGTDARREQAASAARRLEADGYQAIGLDHFALPDDPLAVAARQGTLHRNFQGYTVDPCETLIGVGATSIGRTPKGYVQNVAETGAWARAVTRGELPVAKGHALSAEDALRAEVIEALMCFARADLAAIGARHGAKPGWCADEIAELTAMEADGLLTLEDGVVRMTEAGTPLVRVAAAVFDVYHRSSAARHSVAV